MTVDVGTVDRVIRAAMGFGLCYLAFLSGFPLFAAPFLKYGAAVIGVMMLATSTLQLCPIYPILGLETCRNC